MEERLLPAQPATQDLGALHADLVDWVSGMKKTRKVRLDLDGGNATQPAIQLLLATERALRAKSVSVSVGVNAARILEVSTKPEDM